MRRFLYRFGCIAAAFAVAGQIDSEHIELVVGQVAALQTPNTVVMQSAMDQYKAGQFGSQWLASGVGIQRGVIDSNQHGTVLEDKCAVGPIVPNRQVVAKGVTAQ